MDDRGTLHLENNGYKGPDTLGCPIAKSCTYERCRASLLVPSILCVMQQGMERASTHLI